MMDVLVRRSARIVCWAVCALWSSNAVAQAGDPPSGAPDDPSTTEAPDETPTEATPPANDESPLGDVIPTELPNEDQDAQGPSRDQANDEGPIEASLSTPPLDPFDAERADADDVTYAHAETAKPEDAADDSRRVSITFSPLHLLSPAFEGTIELRVMPGLGIAGIVGAGTISVEDEVTATTERFSVFEAGAQVVWYPLGDFDSLQVGAEILYVHVSGSVDDVEGYGTGVGVGPLVGYKLLTEAGFTLFVQGGFQYVAVRAEAQDSDGNRSRGDDSDIVPFLNFNLGWSF